MNKYRFHILGLAHLPTTKEISACAYTNKIVKLCSMLKSLGHTVYFYGVEGSKVECDEFIQVSTKKVLEKTYGKYDWKKLFFKHDPNDFAHMNFNGAAILEITKRKQPKDFLLITMGNYQKPIADMVGIDLTVEAGIGYSGVFTKYRVFESYAWMHTLYGANDGWNWDGRFYDCVIPNFFDPTDYDYTPEKKENYFLYMGRFIHRKGYTIAIEATERAGAKLLCAGQVDALPKTDPIFTKKHVEFVGYADTKKRKKLLSRAQGVFVPTLYGEPFGGIAVEAMLSGTPVISTDFGVFNETVLHGLTGFRCRTMEQFVWAVKNIANIKPEACRAWALANFSMERVKWMYQEYFDQLQGLYGPGFYSENDTRTELDWLKKTYPCESPLP